MNSMVNANGIAPGTARCLHWPLLRVAVVAAVGLFSLGCGAADEGPPRATVHGTVTFDGEPVEEGTINFIPTGDTTGPSASAKITGGKYELLENAGATVGRNRVEIQAVRKTGEQQESGPPNPPGTMIDVVEAYIPPRYNRNSELAVDIQAGANENVDFDLKSR